MSYKLSYQDNLKSDYYVLRQKFLFFLIKITLIVLLGDSYVEYLLGTYPTSFKASVLGPRQEVIKD